MTKSELRKIVLATLGASRLSTNINEIVDMVAEAENIQEDEQEQKTEVSVPWIGDGILKDAFVTTPVVSVESKHDYKLEKMAEAIKEVGGYIDNRDFGTRMEKEFQRKAKAIVLLKRGDLALWFGRHSCLNEIRIEDDGLPHLSQCAIGDTVYEGAELPDDDSIRKYNESVTYRSREIVDWIEINY